MEDAGDLDRKEQMKKQMQRQMQRLLNAQAREKEQITRAHQLAIEKETKRIEQLEAEVKELRAEVQKLAAERAHKNEVYAKIIRKYLDLAHEVAKDAKLKLVAAGVGGVEGLNEFD